MLKFIIKKDYGKRSADELASLQAWIEENISINDIGTRVLYINTLAKLWGKSPANMIAIIRAASHYTVQIEQDGIKIPAAFVVLTRELKRAYESTVKWRMGRRKTLALTAPLPSHSHSPNANSHDK